MPIMPSTWTLHGVVGHNFNNILDGKLIEYPEVYFWCSRCDTVVDHHIKAVRTCLESCGSVRFGARFMFLGAFRGTAWRSGCTPGHHLGGGTGPTNRAQHGTQETNGRCLDNNQCVQNMFVISKVPSLGSSPSVTCTSRDTCPDYPKHPYQISILPWRPQIPAMIFAS